MTIINGYTDLVTVKAYLGITVTSYDSQLESAVNAASRSIDSYCQRRFWLDAAPVARTFQPDGLTYLEFGYRDPIGGDLGDQTGLIIRTDPGGSGNFTVVWAATDYQLQPVNAGSAYPEARPWTGMRAVGAKTFPWLVNTWLTRLDRVQITAKWGWPAVPADVIQACLIKAARLFHRKDSPQGIAGFGDFGPVRLNKGDDPDVLALLAGYRRSPILVG